MAPASDSIFFIDEVPVVPTGFGLVAARIGGTGTLAAPTEFEVVIDGVAFGLQTVPYPASSSSTVVYTDFYYLVEPVHPSRVDIFFHDDGNTDGIDRNLYVDYIEVNGARLESEIDGMFSRVTGVEVGATEALLWRGTLSFDDLPQAGWSRVVLSVGGSGTVEAPPLYEVFFDGVSAGTFAVANPTPTGSARVYEDVVFDLPERPATVEVAFVNDGTSGTINRNLYIDAITVDSDRFEAEVDGDYTRSNGTEIGPTSSMYWNGSMTFDTAAPEVRTVLLRMAGTGTAEEAPLFDVRIDGVSMGTFAITDPMPSSAEKIFDHYIFEIEGAPPSQVEIEFLNNGDSGTIDRNIYIDYIEVAGVRYESEFDSQYITAAGIDKGSSGDMYWSGTCTFDLIV